jgi:uncharacterized protein YprB with RNaseH-like and TPR domain
MWGREGDRVAKSDDQRKRLEALNRGPLRTAKDGRSGIGDVRRKLLRSRREGRPERAQVVLYRRAIPRSEPRAERAPRPSGEPVSLEQAVDGVEATSAHGGCALLVENRLRELDAREARLCELFRSGVERVDSPLCRRISSVTEMEALEPGDFVFVDVETTGLASAPLFLIGTMVWEDEGLLARQYFARDYSEEAAVTSLFIEAARGKRVLVSFNGKSFDLPYIRARAAANGVEFAISPVHFDLLHECRRAWKEVLPDCKLQTLERSICSRVRESDIPGCEVPDAYHAFVRTENAAEIAAILRHNLLDLVTLAELAVKLPDPG